MNNIQTDNILILKAGPTNVAKFRDLVSRLILTLKDENKILDQQQSYSLDMIVQRKSQLLLELMRANKALQPSMAREFLQSDIENLRSALNENQQKLSIHYAAAKDITNVILEVLRDNESDGTYANGTPTHKFPQ